MLTFSVCHEGCVIVCVCVCVCVSHCLRERIIYRGMSGDPGFSIWEFPAPLNHEDSRLAFLTTVQTRLTFLTTVQTRLTFLITVQTRLTFLTTCS